jgi:hypothetical protein
MTVNIRKARRSATKLRLLLEGPSGSGKTYGGLTVTKGLGCQHVIVIDTEQGSSDLYDSILPFDVIDLSPPFTPERYIEAIEAAEQAGADCIIIDSISHEWNGKGGCLELVDEIARAKFKGNTWSAYSEITPRHRAFIDRMLRSSAHVIATTRSKTETAQVNEGGRTKVVKLGMKAETRDGVEYEFTTCLSLVHDGHFAVASKDRTGLFSGDPKPITVDTGKRLADWLAGGLPSPVASAPTPARTADATGGTGAGQPTRGFWLDRVDNATTVEQLGTIGDEADEAVSTGDLSPTQRKRLDLQIAIRHQQIDGHRPEVANGVA